MSTDILSCHIPKISAFEMAAYMCKNHAYDKNRQKLQNIS